MSGKELPLFANSSRSDRSFELEDNYGQLSERQEYTNGGSINIIFCCLVKVSPNGLMHGYTENTTDVLVGIGGFLLVISISCLAIHVWIKTQRHRVCQHVLIDYTCSADNVKGQQLNWSKRLHIIDGIAQGLLYLHNYSRLCVVHRDLKASNILLDSEMNPKISDFGMARIFCSNMTESNTTRIVGTHGYIPPEYAVHGICSIKSDVFSFGVLVLEIISSKRTAHFYEYNGILYNLISYAWKLWSDGKWGELIYSPPDIGHQEIERCIHVALLCVQERAEHRPDMEYVVTMLNNKDVSLPRPMQPAYFHVNPSKEEVSSCSITMSITLER
ncbi:hypothetical protein EJB05_12151, partial [Eragrostis curvula]